MTTTPRGPRRTLPAGRPVTRLPVQPMMDDGLRSPVSRSGSQASGRRYLLPATARSPSRPVSQSPLRKSQTLASTQWPSGSTSSAGSRAKLIPQTLNGAQDTVMIGSVPNLLDPSPKGGLQRARQPSSHSERSRIDGVTRDRSNLVSEHIDDAKFLEKRRKFSPGDRIAYQAERVDFQAHRSALCYYALVSTDRGVFVHGGQYTSGPDLIVESTTPSLFTWSFRRLGSPNQENIELPPLVGHSMVCYKGNRLFVYGGCGPHTTGMFSDLCAVNLQTRESANLVTSSPQPPGRARHAYCIRGDRMIVHGGHSHRSGNKILSDLWSLDLNDARWTRHNGDVVNPASLMRPPNEVWDDPIDDLALNKPGPRFGHHIATYGEYIWLAFGSDGTRGLTDIWAFHYEKEFWNKIHPRGKTSDPRVDCAATTFGECKWLFHGGLDSSTGSMVNSFYEFNFETHEGRQLRVELSVTPLKILPALMGHSMVSIQCPNGRGGIEEKVVIFGGINRQNTIVHVIYTMRDTGLSPGTMTERARMPAMTRRPLSQEDDEDAKSSLSLTAEWARNTDTAPPSRAVFEQAELQELRTENESLRRKIAKLEQRQARDQLGSTCSAVLNLMARTEETFLQLRELGEVWSQLYRQMEK